MPNPFAIIDHARAKAELERLERKHRSELHRKLDAILAKMSAAERSPDCRTCSRYLPPLSHAGDPACELVSGVIVCINGDAYSSSIPVRLYETGGE